MNPSFSIELARLRQLSVDDLRARYREVCGQETRSRNRDYLLRRIAYGLQEQAFGGLSERARARLAELSAQVPLEFRRPALKGAGAGAGALPRDPRLPPVGAELTRIHKGVLHRVRVLVQGFEHEGVVHSSLSAVARAITGRHWNGFVFFDLAPKTRRA